MLSLTVSSWLHLETHNFIGRTHNSRQNQHRVGARYWNSEEGVALFDAIGGAAFASDHEHQPSSPADWNLAT